jgi:hypothetical protein
VGTITPSVVKRNVMDLRLPKPQLLSSVADQAGLPARVCELLHSVVLRRSDSMTLGLPSAPTATSLIMMPALRRAVHVTLLQHCSTAMQTDERMGARTTRF